MEEMSPTSRGVLFPAELPTFHRLQPQAEMRDLVRWYWIPEWSIAAGRTSRQHLLPYPASNLVVEGGTVLLTGPSTRASHRDLSGTGWAVGALLRPAAASLFTVELRELRDSAIPVAAAALVAEVSAAMECGCSDEERFATATGAIAEWLSSRQAEPTADGLLANEMVDLAESAETIMTVSELAARLHVSARTLQRLADRYVGVSPAALIRRRKLQQAAARLRADPQLSLATLAQELGYADHAHFSRDFRTMLGHTPRAYRAGARDERSIRGSCAASG